MRKTPVQVNELNVGTAGQVRKLVHHPRASQELNLLAFWISRCCQQTSTKGIAGQSARPNRHEKYSLELPQSRQLNKSIWIELVDRVSFELNLLKPPDHFQNCQHSYFHNHRWHRHRCTTSRGHPHQQTEQET